MDEPRRIMAMCRNRGPRLARVMGAAIALVSLCVCATVAFAETRTLKLYFLHTSEKAEVTFKRNGRYDQEGLRKINIILRDWRRNEPTKTDPQLLDLVWEAYRASGANDYINVVSGYRAPATNALLRSRSKGVARESQHMLGKALDFYIPGVPLKRLRDIGLRMQGGGVGYYPSSGSPFVHMDVGNVRHWPGISRQELARVFPNGKTLHVPSDGKPLPGYEQALAAYKSRKSSGDTAIALASMGSSSRSGGLLAALFGGGADEEEDVADVGTAARALKPRSVKQAQAEKSLPGITIVSPENAQRADIQQVTEAAEEVDVQSAAPETIIAALSARSIPLPDFAPRPEGVETLEAASFGMAAAEAAAGSVPLPTWRPGSSIPPDLAPQNQASVLVALADVSQPSTMADMSDGVRTSPKTGRIDPRGRKSGVESVVVPAQLRARYWPLLTDRGVAEVTRSAPAPRIAANFIRKTPVEVYLDRFQLHREPSDYRRFTGSAVTFLPVARFE